MSSDGSTNARCSFDGCSESIISRVVLALVDQLCADADVDIALLDALEFPLGETLSALHGYGVVAVDVRIAANDLQVEIQLATAVPEPDAMLGDAAEAVRSFFDVRAAHDASHVSIVGTLG